MTEPAMAPGGEAVPDLQAAADQAIAACGNDARAAVMALLVMNDALEEELRQTRLVASYGYTRGWHRNRKT